MKTKLFTTSLFATLIACGPISDPGEDGGSSETGILDDSTGESNAGYLWGSFIPHVTVWYNRVSITPEGDYPIPSVWEYSCATEYEDDELKLRAIAEHIPGQTLAWVILINNDDPDELHLIDIRNKVHSAVVDTCGLAAIDAAKEWFIDTNQPGNFDEDAVTHDCVVQAQLPGDTPNASGFPLHRALSPKKEEENPYSDCDIGE